MKNTIIASMLFALSCTAIAQDGNNGNGNGGCGVGQQTNGCGMPIPGPAGPAGPIGPQGPRGEPGAKGDTDAIGTTWQAGAAGANGKDGADGRDAKLPDGLLTRKDVAAMQDWAEKMQREHYAGTSAAMAVASLPQPTLPGKTMVSLGVGAYRSEQGMALGISRVTESNRFVLKGAVTADSRGGVGGSVGAGWQF